MPRHWTCADTGTRRYGQGRAWIGRTSQLTYSTPLTRFADGHSLGGAVTLAAAVPEPDRFSSVFLFEPIVPPTRMGAPVEQNSMAASARKRKEVFNTRVEARERFESRPSLSSLHHEALDRYVMYGLEELLDGTVRLKCRAETEATIYEAAGGISVEDIAEVNQRVTIGSGEPEASMLAAVASGAATGIPAARHIVYPGLSHLGPLEQPSRLTLDLLAHTTR